jgi:hypothetical protein
VCEILKKDEGRIFNLSPATSSSNFPLSNRDKTFTVRIASSFSTSDKLFRLHLRVPMSQEMDQGVDAPPDAPPRLINQSGQLPSIQRAE